MKNSIQEFTAQVNENRKTRSSKRLLSKRKPEGPISVDDTIGEENNDADSVAANKNKRKKSDLFGIGSGSEIGESNIREKMNQFERGPP